MEDLPRSYRLESVPDVVLPLGSMSPDELLAAQSHVLDRIEAGSRDVRIIEQHITTQLVGPMIERLREINEERRLQ